MIAVPDHCPECGALIDEGGRGGFIVILHNENLLGLASLLSGELDQLRCAVCGYKSGVSPALAVVFPRERVVVVAPTDDGGALSQILAEVNNSVGPIKVVDVTSPKALRLDVYNRLSKQLDRMRELDTLVEKDRARKSTTVPSNFSQHWRSFTPDVFVAVCLVSTGRTIEEGWRPDSPEVQHWQQKLAAGQAMVWMQLCVEWGASPPKKGSFENDLAAYLVKTAIVPAWVREFENWADQFAADYRKFPAIGYCLEAARATLYAHLGEPNPRESVWARMYVGVEVQFRKEKTSQRRLSRLRVTPERARLTTSYRSIFDAVVQPLFSHPEEYSRVRAILRDLEMEQVLLDLPNAIRVVTSRPVNLPSAPSMLSEALDANKPARGHKAAAVMQAMEAVEALLAKTFTADTHEQMADVALKYVQNETGRKEILTWLARKLNIVRQPGRVLLRIGDRILPEEEALPPAVKAGLWTERGTALRSIGKFLAARECYERVVQVFKGKTDTGDARTARRNLAIAYRETGAPDRALTMLLDLHKDATGSELLRSFENIATTHLVLGQPKQALTAIEMGLELAVGPFERHQKQLLAQKAMIAASMLPGEAMIEELLKRPLPSADDGQILLAEAAAWLMALYRVPDDDIGDREDVLARVQALANALMLLQERAKAASDAQTEIHTLSSIAYLLDRFEIADPVELWLQVDKIRFDSGRGHDLAALLALARRAYEEGALESGRAWLECVPEAVAGEVGRAQQLAGVTTTLEPFVWLFEKAARSVLDQPKARQEDWRLVSEIRRDAVRRATRAKARLQPKKGRSPDAAENTFRVPSDANLKSLSPEVGVIGILEWLDIGAAHVNILTTIDAAGTVNARRLRLPDVNLGELTTRMLTRLNNWTLDRPGDPFDLKEWLTFEAWVASEISGPLGANGHLVVIEHPTQMGLPFHVAVRNHSTCSYASSWNTILSLRCVVGPVSAEKPCLGTACVPAFEDRPEIIEAFKLSTARTTDFARRSGLRFEQAIEDGCDHKHLSRLLQKCTVLKLLCHGYYDPKEHEVALMIAHSGELPLKLAQAANTPRGRAHRFSWKDIETLGRAPRIVFSGACSSLRAHLVGQGERLGLFASLNERGTQSLVAPGWDIMEPKIVLPIVDSALEKYVGGVNIARALRAVCQRAETAQAVPRWLAWSLSIEGEW
jgi:tetratricopeptide (TPR) repeat protein